MSKATESKLSELHDVVATVLIDAVQAREAVTEFDEEGMEVNTGETKSACSPAMMAAAIKFLKDNSITCDIDTNENMSSLKDMLANKQKRTRLMDAKSAANLQVVG